MGIDKFLNKIDEDRKEYFNRRFNARAYPENRELRKKQYEILERNLDDDFIVEAMSGEGVLSLLAIYNSLAKGAVLTDNNSDVLRLTQTHVESLKLEDRVKIAEMDIEEQTPIWNGTYLAICTEMFNPNDIKLKVLGRSYEPPDAKEFLKAIQQRANKIIVMEAYKKDEKFEVAPDEYMKRVAEEVGFDKITIGREEFEGGVLYYMVIQNG